MTKFFWGKPEEGKRDRGNDGHGGEKILTPRAAPVTTQTCDGSAGRGSAKKKSAVVQESYTGHFDK